MFAGKPTRVVTALVVCAQIITSLFLAIAIPVPQSLAREVAVQFEVSDLPAEPEPEPAFSVAVEEQPVESDEPPVGYTVTYDYWEPADAVAVEPVGEGGVYEADQLRTQGVIYDGDYRYTWYSQRVLPGGGLEIDGRHVSDEGYVVDADERIVVASSDLARGTELDVPFGSGKAVVLDTGCASGTIDVYTDF